MSESLPRIAISLGDPLGIGPEIVRKAIADGRFDGRARIRTFGREGTALTPAQAGSVSFDWVMQAIDACKRGEADAIVTAPISKEHWHAAQVGGAGGWPGHTELLAHEFASPRTAMLFVGPTLRVILATVHIPLSEVPRRLTPHKVFDCIDLGARACRELGIPSPRVAVAGLNPHAGERRLFGDEEPRLIEPAITRARAAGIDASGPHPGDAVFLQAAKGKYDLVVAMYHDQGLIPVKLLDRERAVNVTVGLEWGGRPVVRTSPAHGTAFDIAGKNIADPSSMESAIELAIQMVERARGRGGEVRR